MNTHLTPNFHIPPASLQSIPYMMLTVVVPLYETSFVPLARRLTGKDSGISPLQRVGTGLFIATFSMVAAAIIEHKRRVSTQTLSIFWIAPQFLIFGLSDMFTVVGLIEFFYKQSIQGMQSFLTAMTSLQTLFPQMWPTHLHRLPLQIHVASSAADPVVALQFLQICFYVAADKGDVQNWRESERKLARDAGIRSEWAVLAAGESSGRSEAWHQRSPNEEQTP